MQFKSNRAKTAGKMRYKELMQFAEQSKKVEK